MPPDEAPKGELKCFLCVDGKETPINLPSFETPSQEQMLKDIEQMCRLTVKESERLPLPTHIVGSIDCKPKKIKDFVEDLKILIAAREKYRNPRIPYRKRMIRRADHMRKHQVFYGCILPMEYIEVHFFTKGYKE